MNQIPAQASATERTLPEYDRGGTPTRMVCTALALAVRALVVRIATMW